MLINHFERMERLVSHIFFNVWYNWCINTVTLKIQGGARAPPCPNLPKPMSLVGVFLENVQRRYESAQPALKRIFICVN